MQQQIIVSTQLLIDQQGSDFILQRKKDAASNSIMSCLKLLDSVLSGANREKDELMEEKYANYTVNPNLVKTNEINCSYSDQTVSCNSSLYNSSFACSYNTTNSSIECNETVL